MLKSMQPSMLNVPRAGPLIRRVVPWLEDTTRGPARNNPANNHATAGRAVPGPIKLSRTMPARLASSDFRPCARWSTRDLEALVAFGDVVKAAPLWLVGEVPLSLA